MHNAEPAWHATLFAPDWWVSVVPMMGGGPERRAVIFVAAWLACATMAALVLWLLRRASVSSVGLTACALLFLAHAAFYGSYIDDDAAISMTYARNLALGHGLVLSPGAEPVEGFSNPLWVLALAGLHYVGLPLVFTAKAVGCLLSLGTLVTTWYLARRSLALQPVPSLLAPIAIALSAPFVVWSIAGLENALVASLLILGIAAVHKEGASSKAIWSPLIGFLLALTRPEGILYAVALAGAHLLSLPGQNRRRGGVGWFACCLLPYIAFLLWRHQYFGMWVANTFFAKVKSPGIGGLIQNLMNGTGYGLDAALASGAAVLLVAVGIGVFSQRTAIRAAGAVVCAAILFLWLSGGDWMMGGRFLSHVLPAYALIAAVGMSELNKYLSDRRMSGAVLVAMVAALAGANLMLAINCYSKPTVPLQRVAARGLWYRDIAKLAHVQSASLATPDIGGASLYSGLRVVDLVGLCDRQIAQAVYSGRYGPDFMREYLFHEKLPTFIITHSVWSRRTGIQDIPELATDYYELRTPDPLGPGAPRGCSPFPMRNFVRRDAFIVPKLDGGSSPSEALNEIVELRSRQTVGGSSPACVVIWRLLRPLERGEEYAWDLTRPEGGADAHIARQSLLYGLVQPEDIEPGRWHREYLALPACSDGKLHIALVASDVRNSLEYPADPASH